MNIYRKYCPNVFVAQCEEEHKKGDTIIVETKYGKVQINIQDGTYEPIPEEEGTAVEPEVLKEGK